jgi:hypothetical protein
MLIGRCAGITLLTGATALLPQPPIRLGAEFQVNSYTLDAQTNAAVGIDATGAFVVAWVDFDQDGGPVTGIRAQRFNPAGVKLSTEFQVNAYTIGTQHAPAVGMRSTGEFVIVWQSSGQDGSQYGLFGRRYSSSGVALAAEFRINTYTPDAQRVPAVGVDGDGDFVVVWRSDGQDGSLGGVFGRRFNSAGGAQSVEFQVNTVTAYVEAYPAIATLSDGRFVVAWHGGFDREIFAQRFSSAGTRLGGELMVNEFTSGLQSYPSLVNADGGFVIAWQSVGQDGAAEGVFARRFSSLGSSLGGEFMVPTFTLAAQADPQVTISANGGFVVSWTSATQDGESDGIFARRFSASGVAQGAEVQVNSYTTFPQRRSAAAGLANGRSVVVWQSDEQDISIWGVFAQRLGVGAPALLDVDGDGATAALTDGVLVLRWLFGFTGATLTNSAVGVDCIRCDATAILTYLNATGDTFDVDDNDLKAPLTDGLLVLRFLFGFSGATLVSGAVAGDCMRCDAPAIAGYLGTLT